MPLCGVASENKGEKILKSRKHSSTNYKRKKNFSQLHSSFNSTSWYSGNSLLPCANNGLIFTHTHRVLTSPCARTFRILGASRFASPKCRNSIMGMQFSHRQIFDRKWWLVLFRFLLFPGETHAREHCSRL